MKKLGLFLLMLASAFSFAACGKKKKSVNPDDYITPDVQGNMIKNGNFNSGEVETASSGDQFIGPWWCYNQSGGAGRISITDMHELEVQILKESQFEYCIQVAYDGFKIFRENTYTLEFDAYATYKRKMEVRVQKNGSPYTNYMLAGGVKEEDCFVQLTKKKQHFKFDFKSTLQDKAPRLVFNCGWVEGDKLIEKPSYKVDKNTNEVILTPSECVYIDNVTLICTHDEGIREDTLNRPMITLNQVGFLPDQVKEAVFRKATDKALDTAYTIVTDDAAKEAVYSGSVTALTSKNESSNETCGYADFTEFKTPGKYKIVGNNSGESYSFEIGNDVYDDLANDTIMMLYKQRCGEVLGESGDKFAHDACHQNKARIYGQSSTSTIDVSGGWHDAGDYGKYVVAGAQTVSNLFDTYNIYGDVFTYDNYVTGTDPNIPDILEEAMWELDWMLKMQTSDGKVYHKVTTLSFPDNTVKPTDDKETLYVCPVSYAATADFAAVMAKAAITLEREGIATDKAATYKAAAINAYAALANMSKTSFKNPDDINYGLVKTGEYPDSELDDEYNWASIELYFATGTKSYLDNFTANISKITELGLGWANVDGFAVESYIVNIEGDSNFDATTFQTLVNKVTGLADELVANSKKDVYNITLGKKLVDGKQIYQFEWGSNLTIASNAMILDFASYLTEDATKKAEYIKVLEQQVNYLLGQNANCYCFVTGYGTLSPENPHHRPSIIAKKAMPGMLVGGPDSNFAENGNDAIATNNCEGEAPALCYIDDNNSWSTNEVTIYWNSPFTYAIYAVMNK